MTSVREVFANFEVALRKESVDRNNISANYHIRVRKSRSPQGERG